jgi:riboflavin kinase / FMN adenylyltransferase
VAPERVPPLICSLPQKLRALEATGVSATWLIQFDEAFSRHPGDQFIRDLVRGFGRIHGIYVGRDFHFGYKRSGNWALLENLGPELDFRLPALDTVILDGQVVSSTRIREAIRAGQLESAGRLLGRPYALAGCVVRGDQIGRQLGFPTANLDVAGLVLPPNGVYAVRARSQGQACDAVLNIGFRPTLASPAPQLRVEAHLLDFAGDLYGQELELTLVGKLRDEQTFPSLDALKLQIARDVAAARARLHS